jgi:excinuclease ABC subunit A
MIVECPDSIVVRGARENNLKNISLDIPINKLVVITGPSGSGKSTLAFDTIFAEGQRRYMESLSAYARQFLEQLSKPDVDLIDGLSPAISIEQKTINFHSRSTVGTVTNIYDFLRLLYARMGEVKDPTTGQSLRASTDEDIAQSVLELGFNEKVQVFASVVRGKKGEFLREFEQWRRAGFSKIMVDGKLLDLHDPILLNKNQHHNIDILLDVVTTGAPDFLPRLKEALTLSEKYSEGALKVVLKKDGTEKLLSKKLAAFSTGQSFPDLEPRLFSFNSPYGMCSTCKGVGNVTPETTVNTKRPSIKKLVEDDEVEDEDEEFYKTCPACQGTRLRPESLSVFIEDKNISNLTAMSCEDLRTLMEKGFSERIRKHPVFQRLSSEICPRLRFLEDVGVGYLSLSRATNTLSGGEAQRIRLATQLGSQLSGVLYVLDEPSIGLHPRDQKKLLASLKNLRDLGNTVIVVEHDEDTMLEADHIIDMGPGAGIHGGGLVSEGTPKKILQDSKSLTGQFLSGNKKVFTIPPGGRRKGSGDLIELLGCTGNNLKNVDLCLPLGKFVVFTGVSGSGKSSLVKDTLESALIREFYNSVREPLPFKSLKGTQKIDKIVHVDQRPIGRSPRSNPATYTGLFSALRTVFSQTPEAQIRGYTPGTFSFNVKGGRCDVCEGAGRTKVEMHFLSDVYVPCESCLGSRYRREVLQVRFKGKNIAEILDMTVEQALGFFANQYMIEPKLKTLSEVGLGYIHLGQAATTLSGGEAQRIKLSKELSKKSTGKTLYFLDEPTTGLHFDDVKKLLDLLHRLCETGNTVVVIEHNLDVICSADWIIDIGPEAGSAGGNICFEGTPEELSKASVVSYTKNFVQNFLKK